MIKGYIEVDYLGQLVFNYIYSYDLLLSLIIDENQYYLYNKKEGSKKLVDRQYFAYYLHGGRLC